MARLSYGLRQAQRQGGETSYTDRRRWCRKCLDISNSTLSTWCRSGMTCWGWTFPLLSRCLVKLGYLGTWNLKLSLLGALNRDTLLCPPSSRLLERFFHWCRFPFTQDVSRSLLTCRTTVFFPTYISYLWSTNFLSGLLIRRKNPFVFVSSLSQIQVF